MGKYDNILKKEEKKEAKQITSNIEYMEQCLEFGQKSLVDLENQRTMMGSSLERIEFMLNAISLYNRKGLDADKQKRFDFVKKEAYDGYKGRYDAQLKEIEKLEGQLSRQKEFLWFEASITRKLKEMGK